MQTLGKILDSVPELNRHRKVRAIAIVTVGVKGELDTLRLGMTREQFQQDILPLLASNDGQS